MKKLLFGLVFLLPFAIFSQREANYWHFGYGATLDFQNGTPTTPTTGVMISGMSSSDISDSLGNLLFYVRGGDLVYNRLNDTMANGFGIGGTPNGLQSSLILRKSGSQYYIVIMVPDNYMSSPASSMMKYAVVDMSLASGLGSVTVTDQTITPNATDMAAKLSATKHCNGQDHWILAHTGGAAPGLNHYYAFLATASGISTTPVVSAIGSLQPNNYAGIWGYFRAMHKFSPNGRKVAAGMPYRTVELYDFDKATGVLSNVIRLDSIAAPSPSYTLSDPNVHSLEFSPDGSKLYVTYSNNHPYLCQFDLCAGSDSAVIASKTIIDPDTMTMSTGFFADLQLAPDGKIYVLGAAPNNTVTLNVINNPNAVGALCNYSVQSFTLGACSVYPYFASTGWGFSHFLPDYFEQKPNIPMLTGSITCGTVSYSVPSLCAMAGYSPNSVQWNFGDPVSGANNTSALNSPTHVFSANGTYTVKLALQYASCVDTLTQTINVSGLPSLSVNGNFTVCNGNNVALNFGGATSFSLNQVPVSQSSVVIQPTATTVFTLAGIDAQSGCLSQRQFTVNVNACTALEQQGSRGIIEVFPNPSTGILVLKTSTGGFVQIADLSARVIYENNLSAGSHQIDLSSYCDGLYFVSCLSEKIVHRIKVIKNTSY